MNKTENDTSPFLYGATILGHTVEGENYTSDWWRWEQRPGRIAGGATSQTAAGHWTRFEEDAKLAATLGLNCLLVSVEWSRIEPKRGEFDQDALDHYVRVLKALAKHNITPIVALQAITLPAWFAGAGGWTQKNAADLFASYVEETTRKLSPYCRHWIPLYRICDSLEMGYIHNLWTPGRANVLSISGLLRNTGHALVRASEIICDLNAGAQLGLSYNAPDVLPYDEESPWDYRAARALSAFDSFGINEPSDDMSFWGDPVFPWVETRFSLGDAIDESSLSDLTDEVDAQEYIREFHFVAVSIPARRWVRFAPTAIRRGFLQPVDEDGVGVDFRYRQPDAARISTVMEHFISNDTPVLYIGGANDFASDRERCTYLLDHVEAIHDLKNSGQNVLGYIHESYLDGFEWDRGYSVRRGLVHVDWDTLARTPNQSAYLLGDIARQGGITPGAVRKYCRDWQSRLELAR